MKRAVIVLVSVIVLVVGVFSVSAQTPPPSLSPDQVRQLQSDYQQLQTAYMAEVEKTNALASQSAALRQSLQQTQQAVAPACIAAVEKANPTQTLDPKTFELKAKPAETAKAAPLK